MSYTPEPPTPSDPGEPGGPGDPRGPQKPTTQRIVIWVGVSLVGLYFLITGIVGVITAQH
jgi:hypothetical protein